MECPSMSAWRGCWRQLRSAPSIMSCWNSIAPIAADPCWFFQRTRILDIALTAIVGWVTIRPRQMLPQPNKSWKRNYG